ncbi:MAG: glycosyltransferase [Bacteroidota bacterium]
MEKIKICHVVNIITGKSDGVYTHLKMLFKYLDKNKYQQYLVFQGGSIIEEEAKNLGVIVSSLPSMKKKLSVNTFIDLYRFLKRNEISIIQAHLIKPYIFVGIVNLFLRRKAIFNYNGSFINVPMYYNVIERTLYRILHYIVYAIRSYNIVLVPSKKSKEILLEESHYFAPIEVYYNGCILDENVTILDAQINSKINQLAANKYKIGIIGRFEPQKRVDLAIEVIRKLLLQRSDAHFFFLGDGSLEEDIRQQIITKQLTERVSMLGFVPNVKKYIGLFDILLITSDWEGMPLIMWESMAKGVPIVATDVGGIREIIVEEECGKVYERQNVQQAVTCLNELLNNKLLRERMGENGKKAIAEKYNEKEFSKRFDEIYNSVLHS